MLTETIIEDDRWQETGLDALAETAAVTALLHLGLDSAAHELAILACDDARIAVLNADFRGKPQPTNVLSWPDADLAPTQDGGTPDLPGGGPLGDIAISFDTCAAEADRDGKPFRDHVTHLIVHGLLHCLGYDHERDRDATRMEALEVEILGKLGVPDPYR